MLGDLDPVVGLVVGDLLGAHPQVVELQDLDVTAELRRDHGEVGRDVEIPG